MTLEADSLAERRRLKRRLSFWRIGAILFAVAAVGAILASQGGESAFNFGFEPYIARVSVDERLIMDDREKRKMIKALSENDQVRGVIVFVNSPGGTTVGAEGTVWLTTAVMTCGPLIGSRSPPPARLKCT